MVGKTISHYRITNEIGRGGMGDVYLAEDTRLGRQVALKFLPPELARDPDAKARFTHEARAASALEHPNVCSVYDIGEDAEGHMYMVMPHYEGSTLKEIMSRGGITEALPGGGAARAGSPLPVADAVAISTQVAEGLTAAHAKGIVHRDIKPANIFITKNNTVKILDFGIAKLAGSQTKLTKTGSTVGTAAYMSPEQAMGKEVDQRTDIWSLGVILYEMLAGSLPFRGDYEQALVYSILNEEPPPLATARGDVPGPLRRIVQKALAKDPGQRFQTANDLLKDLKPLQAGAAPSVATGLSMMRLLRRPKVLIPAMLVIGVLAASSFFYFRHQARVRWAREKLLPEIAHIVEENDAWRNLGPAFRLAERAEKVIPNDRLLAKLFSKCSLNINIRTEPPRAKVYMKEYAEPDSEWRYLGLSPLEKVRLPVGIFRWKLEKDGYETVLAAASTWKGSYNKPGIIIPSDLERKLDKKGSIPAGMIRVSGAETPVGKLNDFFIDRCEVTNRQFKEFLNAGGYANRDFWKHTFVREGKELPWEEAIKAFVDQTGQPGPATWQARDYPEGQGDHPVSGVSWHEAAAYAEYAGKSLPTGPHWGIARGESTPLIQLPQLGGYAVFAPFSNFRGKGTLAVGSLPGITSYGACDMAGNVREWCWNETPQGRLIRGGAWDDNSYMFTYLSQAPAMDRSPRNGFRCALYLQSEKIPSAAFQAVSMPAVRDLYKMEPVPDQVYQIYKELYAYDKTDLQALVESRKENPNGWILEKVSFAAAYGDERIPVYLFLPVNSKPPYQAVIYFPGGASAVQPSSTDIENFYEFSMFLSFIVKSGRAALYPVYMGTFERITPAVLAARAALANSHQRMELVIQTVKDFRRCVDYLETRPDIDSGKIAYEGMSWGGNMGLLITAVEERLKASVLMAGSIPGKGRPEIDRMTFIGRVRVPTLMLNGRYDTLYSFEETIKPMFDLLGTPAAHKKMLVYDTDHIPPRNEYIKETLAWLDKYLGPVRMKVE
jgi:dienelactone hydrolase/tRNA A-37 threonylcarbamoyl transferase component Bud32